MPTKHLLSGSGVTRRDMIRMGAGGLGFGLFGGFGPVPRVFSQASLQAAAHDSGKILVVFEWFGGNDGLNTIVPYGDAMYYKHRPTIGIKEKDLLKIDAPTRDALVAFFTGELGTDSLERARSYMEDALRMTVHLIMSTPEYQIV